MLPSHGKLGIQLGLNHTVYRWPILLHNDVVMNQYSHAYIHVNINDMNSTMVD